LDHAGSRAGGRYVPAEALAGAIDLLRRLIGLPLRTVSGRSNTILAVRPPEVLVATRRSPDGQPVPIAWVEDALDRLIKTGQLEIHPRSSTYRSAFIGAVLLTLPGARVSGSPPLIELATPDDLSAAAGDYTFEGDLTRQRTAMVRGEQSVLRQRLFGDAQDGDCALCGQRYPVRFLWAAHIKKRSACTDEQRRDLDNVAISTCVFGCDALFEAGYIAVDSSGHVLAVSAPGPHHPIVERLDLVRGRHLRAHTEASADYFAWHRDNIFRA
jgi:hypothetical protein